MVDVNYETLQSISRRNFGTEFPAALRLATGLTGDAPGIIRQLYGGEPNDNLAELVTVLGGRGANFAGTNGVYWETPNHVSLQLSGDLDFRAEIENVAGATNRNILSRYTPTTNQSYEWRYNGFGSNELVWSTLGNNALTDTTGIYDAKAIRVTMDADDGAGNHIITWLAGDSIDATSWVTINSKTVAGATNIFAGTAVLRIGARGDASGVNPFNGRIRRVQIRSSIGGTIVANPDFRFLAPGTTSFNDSTGKTWTAVGGASIS